QKLAAVQKRMRGHGGYRKEGSGRPMVMIASRAGVRQSIPGHGRLSRLFALAARTRPFLPTVRRLEYIAFVVTDRSRLTTTLLAPGVKKSNEEGHSHDRRT